VSAADNLPAEGNGSLWLRFSIKNQNFANP
jgi:hypothetical protein